MNLLISSFRVFAMVLSFACIQAYGQSVSFVLDADTGNEMDDLYAIVNAVQDKDCEVEALVSAHFNNVQLLTDSIWNSYPTRDIRPLEISQQLNEILLKELGREDIPHPAGCKRKVGYAWGYSPGAPVPASAGVDHLIGEALKLPEGEKLDVVCLGAVTNVAAALETEPAIASRLRVYALNMKYDVERGIWNKNSFNARCDINALDLLLNNVELELIIMPGNVARALTFRREVTMDKLAEKPGALSDVLAERWDHVHASDSWVMWDLALIQALIHPELATLEMRPGPPENLASEIAVYTDIDASKMEEEFWKTYLK